MPSIFDRLWSDYTLQNPDAKRVYDLFISKGERVVNDHIAFRTINHPKINIDVLSRVFLKEGYIFSKDYFFESKRLDARHFELPGHPDAPRVFISELRLQDFSIELQEVANRIIEEIPQGLIDSGELIFSGVSWSKPSFKVYEMLRSESEYAAWFYVNGFRANHFTVSINHLKALNDIYAVNQLLKEHGFLMNNPENEVQGTPLELLEQSSIKAGLMEFDFVEGKHPVPACYYEFAKRYKDANGKLYSGFIAKSADRIFESTDFYKE
jgi:hypothetical protein